ncbi:MAG TPA: hypothetical protein VF108_02570 [Actinomycetota bacterium]
MKFVQIMEMTTEKFDELEALHEQWRTATEGHRTTKLEWVMRDRENPNRYVIAVQFDSYEDAMKNNDLRETGEIAAKMNALTTSPTVFHNLDLIRVDEA